MTRTRYVVTHNGRELGERHDFASTAEMWRLFMTPATEDYRVVPVRETDDAPADPTPDRRTPPRHPGIPT